MSESRLSPEDQSLYSAIVTKAIREYESLYDLSNYPPFSLVSNSEKHFKYLDDLIQEKIKMNAEYDAEKILDVEFRSFADFKRKYKNEINEAKKYKSLSGENDEVALDLYKKESGNSDDVTTYSDLPKRHMEWF